jgi:hypothetical protein
MDRAGFQTLKQKNRLAGVFFRKEQLQDHVRVNDEPALKSCHAASLLGRVPHCRFRGHIGAQWIRACSGLTPANREDRHPAAIGSHSAPAIQGLAS